MNGGSFDGWPPSQMPPASTASPKSTEATTRRPLIADSDLQKAAQGDPGADRRDQYGGAEEHCHEGRESEVLLRGDEGEAVPQRVDDRDLPQPQDQYGHKAAGEADNHPLDHERPADEPAGRADEAHHLHLAAAGVDRKPDGVS